MPLYRPGPAPVAASLDLNTVPFGDRRRPGSGLRPDDPSRYEHLLAEADIAHVEMWGFNFRRQFGRPMKIPVAAFDALKAKGANMMDFEPIKPNMY